MTPAWILAVLMSLPVYREDRAPELAEAKRAQLETVAVAIHDAATETKWPGDKRELASLLIAVGWHETKFSMRMGRGEFKPFEADRGRAVSHWQLQVTATSSPDRWEAARNDVAVAAREAARHLVRSRWMCRSIEANGRDWVPLTIGADAGRGCTAQLKDMPARVATFRRVVVR